MKINGRTIISIIIESVKECTLVDEIVVATSTLKKDDKIANHVKKIGILCFRGSEKNVLERYFQCAKKLNADLIVRLTADNPLLDPKLIDKLIKICKKTGSNYASNVVQPSFPIGFSTCEVFTFKTLKQLYEKHHDELSKEHVTHHIRANPKKYVIGKLVAPKNFRRPNWRLTVDYIEDFELITEIFKKLNPKKSFIPYKKLVQFLDANPELIKINQKYS